MFFKKKNEHKGVLEFNWAMYYEDVANSVSVDEVMKKYKNGDYLKPKQVEQMYLPLIAFYDLENKKILCGNSSSITVPCKGDMVMIGKEWYEVTNRAFREGETYKVTVFVKKSSLPENITKMKNGCQKETKPLQRNKLLKGMKPLKETNS